MTEIPWNADRVVSKSGKARKDPSIPCRYWLSEGTHKAALYGVGVLTVIVFSNGRYTVI